MAVIAERTRGQIYHTCDYFYLAGHALDIQDWAGWEYAKGGRTEEQRLRTLWMVFTI